MAFPDSDLEVVCDFAFGADTTTESPTWTFTDLSSRLVGNPITINRGVLVGQGSHRSASATITLLNDDGYLTPLLPTSPYWPYVDVGTPARIRVRSNTAAWLGDTFTRTVASGWGTVETAYGLPGGSSWLTSGTTSTNGSAGLFTFTSANTVILARLLRPHTDAVVQWDVTLPVMPTGGPVAVGPTLRQPTNNATYLWPTIELQPDGSVVWNLRVDSGLVSMVTAPQYGLTYTAGTTIRCEIELIGPTIKGRAWLASGTKPAAWTFAYQLTFDVAGDKYAGMKAWLYSTNTNTMPFTVQIDNVSFAQPRYPRLEGYITDVRPTFQPLTNGTVHSVVQIDIGGIGSRLEKRAASALSPLRRSLEKAPIPPKVYWPCEDAQGALAAASAFPGGSPMVVTGPAVFSFDTSEPDSAYLHIYGTQNLCSVAAGASLAGAVSPTVGQGAWTVSALIQQFTAGVGGGVTEVRVLEWATPGGTYTRWALVRTMTGHTVRAYNDNAATVTSVCSYTHDFNTLIGFDIAASQSGSTINVTFYLEANVVATGSVTGTLAPVARVTVNPDKTNVTGSVDPFGIKFLAGHVMVHDQATTTAIPYYYDGSTLTRADQGWGYEFAHARFQRLCTEERIPSQVIGDVYSSGTTQLNVQQPGAFTDLITAAIEAESGGLLYEAGFGYTHLPRTQRYNQPVALTVDMSTYRYSRSDAADVLVPKLDARGANYWTVKRTEGSEATAAADATYRNRRGTITDSATLDILSDRSLPDHARWRVHIYSDGTQANYPGLQLDLAANPALIDTFLTVTIGSRVQRTNQPTIAGVGVIDQVIDQMSETFAPRTDSGGPSWTVTLDCSPAGVWDVAVVGVSRYDSASTTLATTVATTTGTSFAVKTVNGSDVWDTAAVPYDWLVDGEQVTVTAITAPVLSGGVYTQTATVTRAVNGVARTHTAGTQIHLANPAYLGL